jgi:hypothetical protein
MRSTTTTRIQPLAATLTLSVVLLTCGRARAGEAPASEAAAPSAPDAEAPETVPPADLADDAFVKDGKLDLDAVVTHFEDLYRSTSSIGTAELKVVKPGRTRTMRMKMWTEGRDKALIVIESPPREKGTATLKVDRNLWNYLPRIRRTIRIPPSMMLASWMGSDFTNDDLVREASYSEDYAYTLVGRSEDPPGWLIRFDAKPDIVGLWERIDLVVSASGRIPLRARYYDRKGRLARTFLWDDVKEFDGRRIPSHMVLVPEDDPGHRTEMRYLDLDFNVDLPASTFSLSRLERSR